MEKYSDLLIGLTDGAIIGRNGVIWCSTPGFTFSIKESSKFPKVFTPKSEVLYYGLTFHGESYAVSSISNGVAIVKNNTSGLVIGKCPNCYIVGFYDDYKRADKCVKAVEKAREAYLQDYSEK